MDRTGLSNPPHNLNPTPVPGVLYLHYNLEIGVDKPSIWIYTAADGQNRWVRVEPGHRYPGPAEEGRFLSVSKTGRPSWNKNGGGSLETHHHQEDDTEEELDR